MKLTAISVRNFKSLVEVEVRLHPEVTVLVGPNAVGKSNFVDALRFMRDAATAGLQDAIARRDGMARIRHQESGPHISVELRAAMAHPDRLGRQESNYFEVKSTGASNDNPLAFAEFESPERLLHDIRNWKFSALNAQTLRTLSTQDADEPLSEDGSNWASVIRKAKRSAKGRHMLERITEMMQVVVPDFQSVSVITAGSYLVPQFKFGSDKANTRTFDPVPLSDGTLRIFGILLSLYQLPTPPLVVIEEPEQTVHPGVLTMLAEAFKEVSEEVQIVVTTHSPQLIEHFEPEQIRVVTMVDGSTQISPIKRSQREAVQRGLMTLGEFMSAEGLQPESESA
jgi:predicted ATPase